MSIKAYQIAIILTIPADSYQDAVAQSVKIADRIDVGSSIGVSVETEYERDGSTANQRVVYLHDENQPLELD